MLKKIVLLIGICLLLIGCAFSKVSKFRETMNANENKNKSDSHIDRKTAKCVDAEMQTPKNSVVIATRQVALEGMNPDDINRLKNIIKSANLSLEYLYINSLLEYRFSDPQSYYWRYLEQTGEFIQDYLYFEGMEEQGKALGLSKEEIEQQFGEPIYANNEYDAERIIQLLQELQNTIHNETFKQNFINMAEYVQKAKETHDVNYILNIYRILHDMDYYLLRYGPEDVGPYVEDTSTIDIYYGILEDYKNTAYYSEDATL